MAAGNKIDGGVGYLVFSGFHDELMMMVSNDDKFKGTIKTGAKRKHESAVVQLPA